MCDMGGDVMSCGYHGGIWMSGKTLQDDSRQNEPQWEHPIAKWFIYLLCVLQQIIPPTVLRSASKEKQGLSGRECKLAYVQ